MNAVNVGLVTFIIQHNRIQGVFLLCKITNLLIYSKEKEYSILLTDTTMSVLKKINPKCEIEQLKDTTLSSAWTEAMSKGQQPSAPEDYIEVEQ